jgi:hypothetical protein
MPVPASAHPTADRSMTRRLAPGPSNSSRCRSQADALLRYPVSTYTRIKKLAIFFRNLAT